MYSRINDEGSKLPQNFPMARLKLARFFPWFILLFSLIITYSLWQNERDATVQRLQDDFDFRVRENSERLQQRLLAYEQILRGAQGLFGASVKVERDEFRTYVTNQRLEENYPGIQGVGFSLIVAPAQKDKHIAAIRKEIHWQGVPVYTIKPEGERSIYTSIIYIEPFSSRNLRAFGYDMYSEPVRRSAMEQARDSGKASISGNVTLVQESAKEVQAGFLMYLPVYQNGRPHDTLTERQANIIGWVYAPFRMKDLMLSLNNERSGELDYEIYDGAQVSDKTLMYDSDNTSGSTTHRRFQSSNRIDIAGHTWMLMIGSFPTFDARLESHRASLIAENGVAISLLLTLMTWLLVSGRQRAYTLAREMNLELIQSGTALRESESRLRVIVESQLICIVTVKNRIIQWANPAYEKLLGYEKGELTRVPARQVFTNDETYQALGENAYPLINSGKVYRTELDYLRKDGSHISAVVSGGALNLDTGESLWACVDITQRKLLELQQRRLSAILMQSNEPVTLIDENECYVYANQAFCKLFDYEMGELLGKSISLLMPLDEDYSSTAPPPLVTAKEKGIFQGEVMWRAKDGTIIPLLLKISPFQNEQGKQSGYVATMTDLTEIKRIENRLRDSAILSQTILGSVIEGLHGLDRDGKIIFENPAATAMFGYDSQEMIGQPAHRLIHHTRADGTPYPQNECHIYATLNDGVTRHIQEEVFWRKDGTSFPVDYTSSPMRNAAGEIIGALVSFRDITERKLSETKLRKLSAAIEQSPISVVIADLDANIEYVNPRFTEVTGYSAEEAIGQNPRILQSGLTPKETHLALWAKVVNGESWHGELINKRKNGEIYWEDAHIAPVKDEAGVISHYVATKVDITQRKRSEEAILESEERFRFILRNSPIAVRIAQLSTSRVVFANHQYSALIGVNSDNVLGVNPRDFYANPFEYDQVIEQISKGDRITNKLVELKVNCDAKSKWVLASYLKLDYEKEPAVLGWFYDISDRKAMEERTQHLAHYDVLVGIPNRLLFSDRLQQALITAKRDNALLALMFIDLDKFKPINDAFGHHVGDILLKEAAKRMQECVRESDTVARIGGDEFVILLPTIETEKDAILVAEKIRYALNQPFELEGRQLNISSSTGVVVYPDHGVDETQLIKNADVAMYYAKEGGRNAVVMFRKDMRVETGRTPWR